MKKPLHNLLGISFGLLGVKEEYEPGTPKKYRKWVVVCSCGNEKVVREDSLLAGRAKSCGCATSRFKKSRMEKRYNLANKKFGKLWVVWREGSEKISSSSHALWMCKCACGNMVIVKGGLLSSGKMKSCGVCDEV